MARVSEDMTKYHNIAINQSLTGNMKINVDGMALKGVRSIEFDTSCDMMPEVTVQVLPSQMNIDVLAKLNIALDIDDVREAANCLQLEMRFDNELRKAVIASAASALIEHDISKDSVTVIAEAVVKRIFEGECL